MVRRTCTVVRADGRPFGATPQRDRPICFVHDPERAADAADARRLGGLRRRRERTVADAYELVGLDSVDGIRRIIEIGVFDALGLESSIPRTRVLISAAGAAARLLETADFDERLRFLEAAQPAPAADRPDALDELEDL